ncbi:MAG: EVE domain-containing protein [Candidatus Njordarchaeia archaeon]
MVVVKFKRRIYEDLIGLLEIAKSAKFAISYIKESGVQLILDYLPEDTRILTCTNFFLTEPKALNLLLDHGVEVRILDLNVTFHPKVGYFLQNSTKAFAIVGSSNLSEGGLKDNIEGSIILEGGREEEIFREINSYLDELWSHPLALDVDKDFINKYEEKWSASQNKIRKIAAHSTTSKIRPDTNYWLFITSPENFDICVRYGLWGVNTFKRMIKEVKIGDLAFFYLKGKFVFVGPFMVISNVFEDETQIWPDKLYPLRIRIKPYGDYKIVNIREILENLRFIDDRRKWGAYLQGEMKNLSKSDFSVIYSA